MVYRMDFMFFTNRAQCACATGVEHFEGAIQEFRMFRLTDIRSNNVIIAVFLAKCQCKFGSYLPTGA